MRALTWLVVGLVVLSLQSAQAFVHNQLSFTWGFHWDLTNLPATVSANTVNRATRAVRYFMASDAYSATNTQAELNALRASFAQWQSITNTSIKFEEGGLVAPRGTINTSDNTNVLFWAKTNLTVAAGANISGALGVTFTTAILNNPPFTATFKEADIVFNGVDYSWYTDFTVPDNTQAFVEGTALHEIGHFIGLDHSPLGAATMFAYSGQGVTAQTGLSVDEIGAAQFIYPKSNVAAQKGALKGVVTRSALGILGAVVTLEDTNGTMVGATVSRSNGVYVMPMITPGSYLARVSPLDPASSSSPLVTGSDISDDYSSAVTTFLPAASTTVTLSAGVTNTLNFTLATNEPAIRISQLLYTKPGVNLYYWAPLSITVTQGQRSVTLGAGATNLPLDATLTISGDGLSVISSSSLSFSGLNFATLKLNVANNATPGLRSFLVQQGTNQAYANGFLKIVPSSPDYNFDGLDDYYQRKYFSLFTSTNASPTADPDKDGFNNSAEYLAGTNPTNTASLLKIEQVKQTAAGTTITWQSGLGKHYQILSRPLAGSGTFQPVGSPVTGTGTTTQFLDATGTNGIKFYRVQAVP